MSGTINRTPCPQCGLIEVLYIDINFVAAPLGTFSLAGAQMKVSGRERPVLKCHNCDFSLLGEIDRGYAVFPQPGEVQATDA